jgi:hypothetical protein
MAALPCLSLPAQDVQVGPPWVCLGVPVDQQVPPSSFFGLDRILLGKHLVERGRPVVKLMVDVVANGTDCERN